MKVTYHGHAALRFEYPDGTVVWADPWLDDNPLAPGGAAVDRCDVWLQTHGHFDHWHPRTVDLIKETGAEAFAPQPVAHYWWPQGVEAGDLNVGGTVESRAGSG